MASVQLPIDSAVTPTKVVLAIVAYFAAKAVYTVFIAPALSPLRNIQGPPAPSFLFGSVNESNGGPKGDQWTLKNVAKYGPVFVQKGMLNADKLYLSDAKAMNDVLCSPKYHLPKAYRAFLPGMSKAEGEPHRRRRKQMGPFFTAGSLNNSVPMMFDCIEKAADLWEERANETSTDGVVEINLVEWLARITQEVIGIAGIGYTFNTLDKWEASTNTYAAAVHGWLSKIGYVTTVFPFAHRVVAWSPSWLAPIAELLPIPTLRGLLHADRVMKETCDELIQRKKADMALGITDSVAGGKDLVSLVLKGNMALPPDQRMTDAEIRDETNSVVFAGHDSSAVVMTGLFMVLAKRPDIQAKLRAEINETYASAGNTNPSSAVLINLPYLSAVVREALRLNLVSEGERQAYADDVIKLSKPIVGRDGKKFDEIKVPKGTRVQLGFVLANRREAVGGDDPLVFRPERWLEEKAGIEDRDAPGMPYNLFGFSAGPHQCIGYRFAVAEIKAVLFGLLRRFEISPAPGMEKAQYCKRGSRRYVATIEGDKEISRAPVLFKLVKD
jgi:cytochrome P450